jgi:ABC-type antimicrobial peptide transport system permease subunit
MNQAPLPQAYVPFAQAPARDLVFFVRTAQPQPALELARREVARLDPALALYEAKTVERALYEDLASNRVITGLFVAFAVVALALATIGLYGVVSYAVEQRTREFGLRMALGAQARDVLRMVLGQGARLIAIGLVLGLGVGALLGRTLAGVLYGVTASDPLTFAGVAVALGGAALAATLVPALRALRADPIAALRAE